MLGATVGTAHPTILDTEATFCRCIDRYTLLQQAASAFLAEVHTLLPHQIEQRTRELVSMQKELSKDDNQILSILTLAGAELHKHPLLKRYGDIHATVIDLLDEMQNELRNIKKQLVNSSTTHRILDTSL